MAIVEKKPALQVASMNAGPLEIVRQGSEELYAELVERLEQSTQCRSEREQLALLRQPYEHAAEPPSYDLLTNSSLHFGHVIQIFPRPFGTRTFCLHIGQRKKR